MDHGRREYIVLVHGFFRTSRDMHALKRLLGRMGFHPLTVEIPATLGTMEQCIERLERFLSELQPPPDVIHFVGHSMGGLVVLNFLARTADVWKGRCVLIASPVKGSSLADRTHAYARPITKIFRGLDALRSASVRGLDTRAAQVVDIGVITGTRGCLLTGVLLQRPHDGRIEVSSVQFEDMKEQVFLPYTHTRIHKERQTAVLIARFLRTGSFGRADRR